ncbi:MAG TPA: hypothetical protein VGH52_07960 [Gaiellaceae bacterium]|jgi:hypothetical protein
MDVLLLLIPVPWVALALLLVRLSGRSVLGTPDGSAIPPQAFGLRAFQTR